MVSLGQNHLIRKQSPRLSQIFWCLGTICLRLMVAPVDVFVTLKVACLVLNSLLGVIFFDSLLFVFLFLFGDYSILSDVLLTLFESFYLVGPWKTLPPGSGVVGRCHLIPTITVSAHEQLNGLFPQQVGL